MSFRNTTTVDQRKQESQRIRAKYPDRVPIIVERHQGAAADTPQIDKQKFLVPRELTMGQFVFIVRKRLNVAAGKAIFVMTEGGVLVPTAHMMGTVDEQYGNDDDGFCYLVYSSENTFGSP